MTWPTFMNYEKDYDRQRRLSVDVHTVCKEHVAILGEKIVALEAKLAKAREALLYISHDVIDATETARNALKDIADDK